MINLLPTQFKEEAQSERRFRFVIILGVLLIAFFLSLSLSLLAIRFYIGGQIEVQRILAEAQRNAAEQSEVVRVRQLNAEVQSIRGFYEERTVFSTMLKRLEDTLPSPVYMTSFTYRPGEKVATISLRGFAPDIEELATLKNNIDLEPLFTITNFPESNWAQEVDINFVIDIEV